MMGQGGWGWQDDHMPMGWQHRGSWYRYDQIAPGATQTFDYTFPASAVGQPFGFGCSQMGQQGARWYPSVVQPQATPASGGTQITIQNFTYQPATLQVRIGTSVTWRNQDNVVHSVTFKNGMKDSGLFSHGQSFSYTFNTPGTYQYYCAVVERRITRPSQIDGEKQTEKEAWNTPEQDPSVMASDLRDVTNPCSVASKQVRQDTTKPIVEIAIS